jgi:hypothetical protein
MKKTILLGTIIVTVLLISISVIYRSHQLISNQHYWFERIKSIYFKKGGTIGDFCIRVDDQSVEVYYPETLTIKDWLDGIDRNTDVTFNEYFGGNVVYMSTDANFKLSVTRKTFLTEDSAEDIIQMFEKIK